MPNWCRNYLIVSGPGVSEFNRSFKGKRVFWERNEFKKCEEDVLKREDEYTFNALYPVPEDVLAAGYEEKGFDWQKQNWGVTRDLQSVSVSAESDALFECDFVSAWVPPEKFFAKVSKDWPDLTFTLKYNDYVSYFAGVSIFEKGELFSKITSGVSVFDRGEGICVSTAIDAAAYQAFLIKNFGYDPFYGRPL